MKAPEYIEITIYKEHAKYLGISFGRERKRKIPYEIVLDRGDLYEQTLKLERRAVNPNTLANEIRDSLVKQGFACDDKGIFPASTLGKKARKESFDAQRLIRQVDRELEKMK